MDSSTSGQTKGGTPKKPLTSRSSVSRSTKPGSPSPSPKVATNTSRPATSRSAEPPSRPAAGKATSGGKEATMAKTSTVRTVTASPNKSRPVQHRDPASPIKPPSNQTSRHQNGDKGPQQTASPLITKTEAGKKRVEGAQMSKPKTTQAGEISTPTKRNGAAKKEVGKLPEHAVVPKDKSPSIRPERNVSVPFKPVASVSNSTKSLKTPSMSNKPTDIVPDKSVSPASLPAKGAKSLSTSPRPTTTSSIATKPVRTLSPLVKTSRSTPISTQSNTTKTSTSSVKPMNILSASPKPGKTSPVKPVNTTLTSNPSKQGKQASATTKQPSVPVKPATSKLVKSSPVIGKSVNEKCAAPEVVMNVEPSISSGESLQAINTKNPSNAENENLVKAANPVKQQINTSFDKVNLPEELVDTLAVLVNKATEHALVDYVETAGERLEESKVPLETINPPVATDQLLAEPYPEDPQVQLSKSLELVVKSPIKQVTPTDEENKFETVCSSNEDVKTPLEQVIVPTEEVKTSMKQEQLRSNLEIEKLSVDPMKPSEEGVNTTVEHIQEQPRSPLDLAKASAETDRPLIEVVETPVESLQEEKSLVPANCSAETDKSLVELVESPVEPLQEEISPLGRAKCSAETSKPLEEEVKTLVEPIEKGVISQVEFVSDLNEEPQILKKQLDKGVTLSMELMKPLEVVQTSSDESPIYLKEEFETQVELVKPSDQTVDLLKTEWEHLKEEANPHVDSCSPLREGKITPVKPFYEGVKSPMECIKPLQEVLTSSLEQITPLEEEVEGEVVSEVQPGTLLKEGVRNPLRHFREPVTSPGELCEALTSSMEEETTSEEEMELLKKEDETIKKRILSPENTNMEEVTCPIGFVDTTKQVLVSSVESVKTLTEEIKTPVDPIEETTTSPKESVKPLEEELSSSGEKLQTSFEPFKPLKERILSPLDLVENTMQHNEEVSFTVANVKCLEGSHSLVKLVEPFKYLEGAEGSTVEAQRLEKEDTTSETAQMISVSSDLEKQAIPDKTSQEEVEITKSPVKTNCPPDQFNSTVEPVKYDAENPCDSMVESIKHLELGNNEARNMDEEQIQEQSPVETVGPAAEQEHLSDGSELFGNPILKINEPVKGPSGRVTVEKQLHSAQAGIDVVSSPIKPGHSDLDSVLFPEEPLTSEMVLLETANYPEEELKSSLEVLEQVKCPNYGEEVTILSKWELMGSPENLVPSTENSVTTICEAGDIAISPLVQPSENMEIYAKESIKNSAIPDTLPTQKQNDLLESESLTTVDTAPVEISAEPQEEEAFIDRLVAVHYDIVKPTEEPVKYEILMELEKPVNTINIPVMPTVENHSFNYPLKYVEESATPTAESVRKPNCTAEVESVTVTSESERSPLKSSMVPEITMIVDSAEQVYNLSANIDIDVEQSLKENNSKTTEELHASREPVPLTAEESLKPLQKPTDLVEETMTISVEATNPFIEATEDSVENTTFSEESVVPQSELTHTLSLIKNTVQTLSTEQSCEANNASDVLLYHTMTVGPSAIPQESEKESWVLVQRDELADFKENAEERPLRPATLGQEGDMQEEQNKTEEEVVERASVCSTLSDPQLAGQSSSETSTPEELKTYEDTSSGVESHSDEVATSPQTTLTPDPDLGIHMGQEEGADTPAGTPASKSKGVPHPLQNAGIEGQSQDTSPSAISDSENDQIVRKREVTAVNCPLTSTVLGEQRYEEGAEERGAQRGNDD
ncbi:proline-rich protein 36 isoform X2 [Mixophyes fleayi]|uniref:proline-rich protein 36 isoform X2 n=1 Tax=Mixophyes fleayi TaxID=3061075 RepID=UPI003F4DFFA8